MSIAARRLQRVATAPQQWRWYGSALDSTGGNMCAHYDGADWFVTVDIAGVARLNPATKHMDMWQQGRPRVSGTILEPQLGKGAAIWSNGTTAWSLAGTATASSQGGGIHKRNKSSGIWQLLTESYYGDVEGVIGQARRPVGHRRIYQFGTSGAVFVACQRASDNNGGIARSLDGVNFHDFHPASGFSLGRMYRAIVGSENNFANVIYVCADSATGDGASAGASPCVGLYANASASDPATATFIRLDTIGTNNPGGLTDAMTMICINESGSDALYVISGENDTTKGGVWRCTINGDPSSPAWQSSPSLTWQKINGTSLQASHAYRTITGQRVGSATYLIVGNAPTVGDSPNLAGLDLPHTTTPYRANFYRCLNGHTATPTWEAISADVNLAPGGAYHPVYGTNNETWVMLTGSQGQNTVKSSLGGNGWIPYDMDIDPVSQTIITAGKAGSWICENPWDATLSNVTWQVASNSTGGVLNDHIYSHPDDNKKWVMTDHDRYGYYNLDGGEGQMHGIENALPNLRSFACYIRQEGPLRGRWLAAGEDGIIRVSDDWHTVTNPDLLPTFSVDTTPTTSGANALIHAVTEFSYAGTDYRLAFNDGGQLMKRSLPSGSWSIAYTITMPTNKKTATFIANDGFKDFWLMVPTVGLFYFSDITNITAPTNIFPVAVSSSDNDLAGRVAQDSLDRTKLYVTWGRVLSGVWQLTGADDLVLNSSGSKVSGTGSVTRLSGGALTTTTNCGSIDCDPTDNSLVVLIPGYSGTPDVLYYNGATWVSIADSLYQEFGMLPVWLHKRGNRMYAGQFNAGVPFAVYS